MSLTLRPGSEFNAVGAPSEELKRKLLYLAVTDGESILSGFTGIEGFGTASESKEAEKANADTIFTLMQMQMAEANQERIEQLNARLDRLDRASYEALRETEEQLRLAREELNLIRDNAFEITFPDGTVKKVYRGGDTVRTEDGAVVSPDIIRSEDIPDGASNWTAFETHAEKVARLTGQRDRIIEYRAKLDVARDRLQDSPSPDDLDDLDAELAQMPDAVSRRLEPPSSDSRGSQRTQHIFGQRFNRRNFPRHCRHYTAL